TTYYTGNGAFRQRIKGNGDGEVVCKIKYQACDASMCMPPVTKTINIAVR
ncbi:MAG: protein-disulfide reductase DsbD N-terminal domain-containing protein, partial [Duncaniella sp.]|nr:protein-disulfide reductase DsbD N-terminal domain-containing protein [Duncaniella sp.]